MIELKAFYNKGFGWICRHCESKHMAVPAPVRKHSRLMHEGEAESKQLILSIPALAKWADPAHKSLVCPTCEISEVADKS